MRRNGAVVPFEASKISIAMTKAFLAVQGGTSAASAKVRQMTEEFTARVEKALLKKVTIRWNNSYRRNSRSS